MPNNKIFSNVIIRWSGEILSKGLWFFFLIYLARKLGVEQFGQLNYALSFSALLIVFTDFGTNLFLVRRVAAEKNIYEKENVLNQVLWFKVITTIILLLIAVVLQRHNNISGTATLIITLSFAISAFLDPLNSIYRAHKHINIETYIMFYWRILIVVIGFILISFHNDILYIAVALLFSAITALIISIKVLKKKYGIAAFLFHKLNFKLWPKILFSSLWINLVIIIITFIGRYNVIVLEKYSSTAQLGYYGASYKLLEGTFFIPSLLIASILPHFIESNVGNTLSNYGKKLFFKALYTLVFLSTLLALPLFFFSDMVIKLLYGNAYIPAAITLKVMAVTLIFFFINELLYCIILSLNKERTVVINAFFAIVLYLPFCYIIIPSQGALGAAISLFVGHFVLCLLNFLYFTKLYFSNKLTKNNFC